MVLANVSCEATFWLFVEGKSLEVANETLSIFILFFKALHLTKLGKSVDDDTKKNVVKDNLKN